MSGSQDSSTEEKLDLFFERRQLFLGEIDSLRAQASALWDKYRKDGNLTMAEAALLEGIRRQRQDVFNSFQADEESFIDLVLKRRAL